MDTSPKENLLQGQGGLGSRATPEAAPGARAAMRGFMLLFMTAFVLDMAEDWKHPLWTAAMLGIVAAVVATGVRWSGFVLFLIAATVTLLRLEGFQGGNHNNLCLLASLLLLAIFAVLAARGRWGDDEVLLACAGPPLRVGIALVYFFAGFHKLNWDFLNPEVSCGVQFANNFSRMVHLPVTVRDLPPALQLVPVVLVLMWELGCGLGLMLRRFQLPALLVCWCMHAVLAMMVFFDFSAFAFALLWLFVPLNQVALVEAAPVGLAGRTLDRLKLFALLNLAASLAAGGFYMTYGQHRWAQYLQGLVFNLALLMMIWPMLRQLLPRWQAQPWRGAPLWTRRTPLGLALFPALIVFLGMNPYLGLRTAGVFTMFSNLRTEGSRSNHILLGSNPLKLFAYQEDLVEIIAIDPRHARGPSSDLNGYFLPAVEFRARLIAWRKEGPKGLWATYRYRGQLYETQDLVSDPPWDLDRFDPALWLMDFRVVQPEGEPTKCRW